MSDDRTHERHATFASVDEIVLASLNKTRPLTQAEFWQRYERNCKRQPCVALPGQAIAALKRLHAAGKIVLSGNPGSKLARLN